MLGFKQMTKAVEFEHTSQGYRMEVLQDRLVVVDLSSGCSSVDLYEGWISGLSMRARRSIQMRLTM